MVNATIGPRSRRGVQRQPLGSFESARFRGNPVMRPGTKPGSPRRLPRSNVSTKVINSSISTFVCGSSANAIRSSEQQREDGSEKLAHEIDVAVLAGCSEQALDRQPAQHADLDALPKTGLGLGVEADFLATLASHPHEAVSHEFDAICILRRDRARASRADASPVSDSRRAHPSRCSACLSADRDCRSR